jgi:hypothetical protein
LREFEVLTPGQEQKVVCRKELKEKMKRYFAGYLSERMKHPIALPVVITYDKEDEIFVNEIRKLVLDMCQEVSKRPTY